MPYSSRLELQIDSRTGEQSLQRMERRLEGVERAGSRADGSVKSMSGSLGGLRAAALAASGALAALGVGQLSRETFAAVRSAETLRASLKTVTGSVENASAAWESLLEFASETPFTLEQSVQGFIRMKSLGLDPTQESLRSFGNTASAMGKDMMQMVEAVADATTGEFERLKEFGIRARKEGDQITFTFQGVETTVRNSSEAINEYLQDIGENQFAGAMADQMDTLGGKASNLEDSIYQLYLAIGEAGATDAFNAALDGSIGTVEALTNNIDTLATAAGGLAVVAGSRLAVALGSATTAMVAKTAANIADAKAEAVAAQQTVRRTAAELSAANTIRARAVADAKATAGTNAHAFAMQNLTAASTRATAAQAAHTSATNVATAAMGRASIAARGLSGAMTLLGGPAGAILATVGGLALLGQHFDDSAEKAKEMEFRANELAESLRLMGETSIRTQLAGITLELAAMDGAQQALEEQSRKSSRTNSVLGAEFQNLHDTIQTTVVAARHGSEEHEKLRTQQMALEKALELVTNSGDSASRSITQYSSISKEAAKAAKEQADSLEALRREMDPLRAEHAAYTERVGVLNQALAEGTIEHDEYGNAVRWAADQYVQAATGAEEYEKQTESLVQQYDRQHQKAQQLRNDLAAVNEMYRQGDVDGQAYQRMVASIRDDMRELALEADPAAQEMARAWEEASNRIDETFSDAFAGAFESFDDFGDQLLDGFKRLLAELAYQATLKPIVVGFTGDMQGLMSGQSGGGFGGTLSAARSVLSGTNSLSGLGGLFGGGIGAAGTAATGYAGAGFASQVATGGYTGFAGSAAAGSAAGGGLMSGLGAAMPWVGAGLLADNVLGLGIVEGITDAIGGLFGGGKSSPSLDLTTLAPRGSYRGVLEDSSRAVHASGAFGTVGFADAGTSRLNDQFGGDFDKAREFLEAIANTDNLVAGLAQTEAQLDAMTEAAREFSLRGGSPQEVLDQLGSRTSAIIGAVDGQFGQFLATLDGGAEEIVAQAMQAQQAVSLLGTASEHLNVQFNATGTGAYTAATGLVEMVGGLDALSGMQQQYYQAFFSEAEREARTRAEMTSALQQVNLQLPETRDGYRQLIQAQNLNTEAGREAYAVLLQMSGTFAELVPAAEGAATGIEAMTQRLDELRDIASEREDDVRRAWQAFESQSFGQQIALLELIGDSEAALAMQRERELAGIDPLLHETQRRIWAIEDEAAAQQEATRAAADYQRELSSVRSQLESTLGSIGEWVDTQRATGGTPGNNLASAGDQFARQLALAEGGDRSALQSITQYADRYLAAGQEMFASGTGAQRIERDVISALENLPDALTAEEFLADEIREALQEAVDNLPGGIASALSPMFDAIDLDASGLIDYREFASAFDGMATDDQLKRIFLQLDTNGDGQISRLEALNRSSEGTEGNTKTLDQRAREQLRELTDLVQETQSSTGQLIDLNGSIVSLGDSLDALRDAQRDAMAADRQYQDFMARATSVSMMRAEMSESESIIASSMGQMSAAQIAQLDSFVGNNARGEDGQLTQSDWERVRNNINNNDNISKAAADYVLHTAATMLREGRIEDWEAIIAGQQYTPDRFFAQGGVFTNSVVDKPTSFSMGMMGEAGPEAIMPLHRSGNGSLGIRAELPPLPSLLGQSDVADVLRDLKAEVTHLRRENREMQQQIAGNTGQTRDAVAATGSDAHQQRERQARELQRLNRNAKLKVRT